jgi:hypothetical protein
MRLKSLSFLLLISLFASFALAASPEVKVPKSDLERLTGSYANVEMGFAFKVDLEGGRLILNFTEGAPFKNNLLIPISSTRFRVEGEGLAPGLQATFQLPEEGGKAESATIIQPGMPIVVMKRVN